MKINIVNKIKKFPFINLLYNITYTVFFVEYFFEYRLIQLNKFDLFEMDNTDNNYFCRIFKQILYRPLLTVLYNRILIRHQIHVILTTINLTGQL